MTRNTGNYDEYHLEWLKDSENSAAFLNAVFENNDSEAFLLALRDVAQTQSGRKGERGVYRHGKRTF